MAVASGAHMCRIAHASGYDEVCTELACPFWETGNIPGSGACAFEEVDLSGRDDLAVLLDHLRRSLAESEAEAHARLRHEFYERLNAGRAD